MVQVLGLLLLHPAAQQRPAVETLERLLLPLESETPISLKLRLRSLI